MREALAARFKSNEGGDLWLCPCCSAKLARVCELKQFAGPSCETKIVAGLKLPAGYKFIEGRRVWARLSNPHPLRAGQHERRARQKLREQLRQSVENAERKGDLSTVAYNGQKLANVGKGDVDKQRAQVQEPELTADLLPAVVRCPNKQCAQQWEIPSVRSAAAYVRI